MGQKDNRKVIPFPGLESKILNKAITTMKDKRYKEALPLFRQLYEMNAYHPQAAYGLAVCLVEVGDYEEAREITNEMLKKDVGNYFDVLKLHLTVLIQEREYKEVLDLTQAVIEEGNVPADIAQTLNHLSFFAEKRLKEPESDLEPIYPDTSMGDSERLLNGTTDEQWTEARRVLETYTHGDQDLLLKYLKQPQGDPFIKSMVLQEMKKKGYDDSVTVNKFNEHYLINLQEEELFYGDFADTVHKLLNQTLGSDNPAFLNQAEELWRHFLISVYPLPVSNIPPKIWAEAVNFYVHQMNGQFAEADKIKNDNHEFSQAVDYIARVEKARTEGEI